MNNVKFFKITVHYYSDIKYCKKMYSPILAPTGVEKGFPIRALEKKDIFAYLHSKIICNNLQNFSPYTTQNNHKKYCQWLSKQYTSSCQILEDHFCLLQYHLGYLFITEINL